MSLKLNILTGAILALLATAPALTAQAQSVGPTTPATAETDAEALTCYRQAEALATAHLATFDTLDFDVYTNQKWDRLAESHSPDILVHWPDGHTTRGLARHIQDLKAQFTYAPDSRVEDHPVRIANGDWTAVTGVFKGTFTLPMHTPDGHIIQPTGKTFSLPMVTVGHWVNGVMDEEYLFWDNAAFVSQVGIGS